MLVYLILLGRTYTYEHVVYTRVRWATIEFVPLFSDVGACSGSDPIHSHRIDLY